MPLTNVKLQEIVAPLKGFPAHLFVREGLSEERGGDRTIPDLNRWDFAVEGGRVVRDNRTFNASSDDEPLTPLYDEEARCFVIPAGVTVDFSCYFNMLSAAKWLELTTIENVVLNLELEGEGRIDVYAYQLAPFETRSDIGPFRDEQYYGKDDTRIKTAELTSASFSFPQRAALDVAVGHPDATLVGFAVTARSDVYLHAGQWRAFIEEEGVREVDLCAITTTFCKEEFVTRNVRALQEMMRLDADMAAHFRVIVVDNGQTLDVRELEDDRTSVFPNKNVGGAGGFARGMIEALRSPSVPTHVIIMDDDVFILPETVKRTYNLLRLLKPEFHDHYISGAMLRFEDRDIQHEDIGCIDRLGFFAPKKPAHRLSTIVDCAYNEVSWPLYKHEYAAWWYCCIPMQFVREDSLPIPVFVRGDDVEFSLRNNARLISMNGIGVWHVGFGQKFSAQMEYYQVIRNSFILRAFHPERAELNFLHRVNDLFTFLMCEFAYDYADLLLDALEDYLSGPSIIEKPNGIDIVKEKSKFNEKMLPLADVWPCDVDFAEVYSWKGERLPNQFVRRRLTELSLNGQLMFESQVTDEVGFVPYDWEFRYGPLYMKRRLVSVNPYACTAIIRERDEQRFAAILKRKVELFDRYHAESEQVEATYREEYPRLTSIGFWKGYLGID